MDDGKKDEIVYPLPGDGKGQPIGSGITGSDGKLSLKVKYLRPGRYHLQAASEDGRVRSRVITTQVTPKCDTEEDIRQGNRTIRASILGATTVKELDECKAESRMYVDFAEQRLKNFALKQYEETCKKAGDRIEQLRLTDKKWGVKASVHGFGLKKATKKSKVKLI